MDTNKEYQKLVQKSYEGKYGKVIKRLDARREELYTKINGKRDYLKRLEDANKGHYSHAIATKNQIRDHEDELIQVINATNLLLEDQEKEG